jgi:hypothetical protein
MSAIISCVYENYGAAAEAIRKLEAAGISRSHISILASNADGWYHADGSPVDPKHDKDRDGRDDRAEGAAAGAGIGAVALGAIGALAGLGLLAVPGIGPIVAAGWLASTAAGAVAGGAAGGIVGALVESGISRENAELYLESIRRGGTLVSARVPEDERDRYERILASSAIDVSRRESVYRQTGWNGYDPNRPACDLAEIEAERQRYRT